MPLPIFAVFLPGFDGSGDQDHLVLWVKAAEEQEVSVLAPEGSTIQRLPYNIADDHDTAVAMGVDFILPDEALQFREKAHDLVAKEQA